MVVSCLEATSSALILDAKTREALGLDITAQIEQLVAEKGQRFRMTVEQPSPHLSFPRTSTKHVTGLGMGMGGDNQISIGGNGEGLVWQ